MRKIYLGNIAFNATERDLRKSYERSLLKRKNINEERQGRKG